MKLSILLTSTALLAMSVSACVVVDRLPFNEQPEMTKVDLAANAAAALAHPDRLEGDSDADERRKAAETIVFAGIAPGMNVMELEAGAGYFTELFSRAVGPEGSVVMQNPAGFDAFIKDGYEKRLGNDRLPNVRLTKSNFDMLDAPDNSMDVVTWFQGPHELYFEFNGQSLGDVDTAYAEIYRVLKPGGVFVALDHRAVDRSSTEVGGTLHRIHPRHVVAEATQAGLVKVDSSDILENPDDPLDNSVFDESIRGKTSQFIIKFRKPE